MTPAITLLDELKLEYHLHQYQHNPSTNAYGQEAIEKMGVAAERVFKTLILESNSGDIAVAVIPADQQLKLKAVAAILHCKKVSMLDKRRVPAVTGYIVGAVSPIAQSQRYPTLIDESAHLHPTIYVSAGRRGLELELEPALLQQVCAAEFASLVQTER